MTIKAFIAIFTFLISLNVFGSEGFSRQWKPSATKAAQEYLNLNHQLKNGDNVFLMWIAPQYLESKPGIEPVLDLLKKYTIVGIVHYGVDQTGQFKFSGIENVTLETAGSKTLQPLAADQLPPLIPTFTTFLSKTLAGGMGRAGEAMRYFTFDAGGIDGCGGKAFFVNYLDERYEYKAPIPGC